MKIRVVDIETSGLPEDELHAICEIGWVDINLVDMSINAPVTFFVDPGHPIPPHIRGIHHISDAKVAGAMTPAEAVETLLAGLAPEDLLAAHKASFEQAFIDAGEHRWICTWKCAMRAWQDAKSHSNQALRYTLEIDAEADFPADQAMPPHRALPDAWVTAFILRRLLQLRDISRLVEITGEPPLTTNINFGKHKGLRWLDLPYDYLEWIRDKSDMDQDTKGAAQYWLKAKEAKMS